MADSSDTAENPAGTDGDETKRDGWWSRLGKNAVVVTSVGAVVTTLVGVVATGVTKDWFEDKPPSCPGSDCDGRNPEKQGCGEHAATYKPRTDNPVQLSVRYSERCGSVWGRIVSGEPGDRVSVSVADGSTRAAEIAYDRDQFTRMVTVDPAEFRVKVCAEPTYTGDREGTWRAYCIHATESSPWL